MDRKPKPDHRSGEKSSNGGRRSKEEALGKIHQMEWMRNNKESWHLSRSNSRGEDVQEKKKVNKNEESYFEGTGNQKMRKSRKPRQADTPLPPHVPPGFSILSGPSGPPPVNAWSKKKGSALFSKPPEEVDDEDEMLKLVLQESLKTAEDEKKNRERLMMFSEEAQSSTKTDKFADEEWEDTVSDEEYYSDPPKFGKQSQATDAHFVDTDSPEDTSMSRRPAPPRTRVSSGPRDKFPSPPFFDKNNQYSYDQPRPQGKILPPARVVKDNNYNTFEPSRPTVEDELYDESYKNPRNQKVYSQSSVKNIGYDSSKPLTSHKKPTPNREILIPEKDYKTSVDDVSGSLESTLTFGDTEGLLEREGHYGFSSLPQSYQFESQLSERETSDKTPSSKTNISDYSDSLQTDIMLHSFIRHEPPSSLVPKAVTTQKPDTPTEMSANGSKQYYHADSPQFEQHNLLNNLPTGNPQSVLLNTNGRDSSSSLSDSPSQNVSPYGSFDKQVTFGAAEHTQLPTQNAQLPYLYPLTAHNHQELFATRALTPQVAYPNIPPGYIPPNHGIRAMLPQPNQITGMPNYQLPNSNLIMPSLHQDLHNLPSHLYQAQLQHLLVTNALNQYQQHTFNVPESPDIPQKEQTSAASQSQGIQKSQVILSQSQSQIFPTQNHPQPQMLLAQNHSQRLMMQNQPQMAAQNPDMSLPKEDSYLKDHQQISSQNHQFDQPIPQRGKTKEEILLQYQQALQTVSQLEQQLSESELQTPPIQIPQPQAFLYPSHPMVMGMSSYYQGMPVSPQVLQQLNQQVPRAEQTSPNHLPSQANIASRPSMSPPEMNVVPTAMEPQVGRGRGRVL